MTWLLDPAELEVWNHRFDAIAEEMGMVLMRAAFSSNIKERRDYSCAIFTREGRMLAQAAHIPVHLGSAPLSVQAVAAAVSLGPGQVGIVNDPFAGGTHLPDITLVEPLFTKGERAPVLWVANRAHHADVGGSAPGSMPLCTRLEDEGFVIGPQLLTPELETSFLAAVRQPEERRGDLRAQRAANERGILRLAELCEERGRDELEAGARALFEWSKRWMERVFSRFPPGRFAFEDWLDDDGLGSGPIRLAVELWVQDGRLHVDFRGCQEQVPGPMNAVRSIVVSCVHYVLRCLAGPGLPSNDGFMELVDIHTTPGTVVDALPGAAVGAGNVETSQRLTDVLLGALAKAFPEQIPAASCGSMNNVLFGGRDGTGRGFTYYETIAGGSGAGPGHRGESGVHTHMTNTWNTPAEALEHSYPVRLLEYRLREGSGGAGAFRGGDGIVRRYRFLDAAEVTLIGCRHHRGAYGLAGGHAGQPGRFALMDPAGAERVLPSKVQFSVAPGSELIIETPGGGGFGET
jgi:N-methylhydantoinase B